MQCRPVQQLTPAEQAVSSFPPCRVQKSTLPARRRPPRQRRKESKRGRRMCVLCVIIARRARAPFFLCHSAAASPSRARRKDAGRHANKRPTPASTTRRLVFCAMSAARPPAGVVGRVLSPSSVHLVFVLFVIRPNPRGLCAAISQRPWRYAWRMQAKVVRMCSSAPGWRPESWRWGPIEGEGRRRPGEDPITMISNAINKREEETGGAAKRTGTTVDDHSVAACRLADAWLRWIRGTPSDGASGGSLLLLLLSRHDNTMTADSRPTPRTCHICR